jgi:hypothetical protein
VHQNARPIVPAELLALAPIRLANHRHDRFRGDAQRALLKDFDPDDRKLLGSIYQNLQTLLLDLRPWVGDDEPLRSALIRLGALREQVADDSAAFGRKTAQGRAASHILQIIHDLRGGALFTLLLRWEIFAAAPEKSAGLSPFFFLVRDHLKIMRNCVGDLDPARFQADSGAKDHGAELLVEKWSNADFYGGIIPARIEFTCAYQGTVCESCLEFSTLDRIIYNLVNNAARYADDHLVRFYILPVPEGEPNGPENLRFVIGNHVAPGHRETLNSALGDLGQLFQSDFTTGGHGIGTQIVGDFCAQAYGIMESETARKQGYFGARWLGDSFVAWFHWPIAGL